MITRQGKFVFPSCVLQFLKEQNLASKLDDYNQLIRISLGHFLNKLQENMALFQKTTKLLLHK